MKIQQKCDEKLTNPSVALLNIPAGTVFYHTNHEYGPYLKVTGGIVNLSANTYAAYADSTLFNNYLALPNARVVLE